MAMIPIIDLVRFHGIPTTNGRIYCIYKKIIRHERSDNQVEEISSNRSSALLANEFL